MKILGSIGRALVRYSERSATSVPPKSAGRAALDNMDLGLLGSGAALKQASEIEDIPSFLGVPAGHSQDSLKQVLARHAGPSVDLPPVLGGDKVKVRHVAHIETAGRSIDEVQSEIADAIRAFMEAKASEAERVADAFPTASEPSGHILADGRQLPHPDAMSWGDMLEMRSRSLLPGWSFCRFPVRHVGEGRDGVFWAFGVVRDHFGVIWEPFWHCHDGSERPLAVMFHLASGTAIAVMINMALACEAAEAMLKIDGIAWPSIDPHVPGTWEKHRARITNLWAQLGLAPMPYHVHAMQGGEITGEVREVLGRTKESITPTGKLS